MSQQPRVYVSDLTGRAYVTTRYTEDPRGGLLAHIKHDVTADVVEDLMAFAWARGWNECNAASEGDAPPNPYRPIDDARRESARAGMSDEENER